jgi:hypothetical protein
MRFSVERSRRHQLCLMSFSTSKPTSKPGNSSNDLGLQILKISQLTAQLRLNSSSIAEVRELIRQTQTSLSQLPKSAQRSKLERDLKTVVDRFQRAIKSRRGESEPLLAEESTEALSHNLQQEVQHQINIQSQIHSQLIVIDQEVEYNASLIQARG